MGAYSNNVKYCGVESAWVGLLAILWEVVMSQKGWCLRKKKKKKSGIHPSRIYLFNPQADSWKLEQFSSCQEKLPCCLIVFLVEITFIFFIKYFIYIGILYINYFSFKSLLQIPFLKFYSAKILHTMLFIHLKYTT